MVKRLVLGTTLHAEGETRERHVKILGARVSEPLLAVPRPLPPLNLLTLLPSEAAAQALTPRTRELTWERAGWR